MSQTLLPSTLAVTIGFYLLAILGLVLIAVLLAWASPRLARLLLPFNRIGPRSRRPDPRREHTLIRLYASLISAVAFAVVVMLILRMFVDSTQIIWIVGLFSAGFGLGARTLVADLIAGGGYIGRNTFAIGEKVEFVVGMNKVEGIVEDVNMRTTLVRANTGEVYTLPNGEIGIIRNFSRGQFSGAEWKVSVPTAQLNRAVDTLHQLGKEADAHFPALIDPWTILLGDGRISAHTTLTLVAHFDYGQAAALKPRVAAFIYDGLCAAGIDISGEDAATAVDATAEPIA
jgi:small conductance mechanosensitive channel